jgi:hypothetical protein
MKNNEQLINTWQENGFINYPFYTVQVRINLKIDGEGLF